VAIAASPLSVVTFERSTSGYWESEGRSSAPLHGHHGIILFITYLPRSNPFVDRTTAREGYLGLEGAFTLDPSVGTAAGEVSPTSVVGGIVGVPKSGPVSFC
jgi:hypothetical protein